MRCDHRAQSWQQLAGDRDAVHANLGAAHFVDSRRGVHVACPLQNRRRIIRMPWVTEVAAENLRTEPKQAAPQGEFNAREGMQTMSVHVRGSRRVLCLAAVATLTIAAAGAAHAQQKTDVIFSAGPTGGSWTPMAAAASQVVNKRFPDLNVQVEPGAALVNMEKIRNDKADIGWSMTTVMSDAQKGEGQFAGKQTDKGLFVANFYPNVWQLVVPANSDIKSVKDLKGQPVALPSRGNTSLAAGWEYLLKVNGMTLNDLGAKSYGPVSSNAEAVKNRQAMAVGLVHGGAGVLHHGPRLGDAGAGARGHQRGDGRPAEAQSGLRALHPQGRSLQGPGRDRGRADLPVAHRADRILQDLSPT